MMKESLHLHASMMWKIPFDTVIIKLIDGSKKCNEYKSYTSL